MQIIRTVEEMIAFRNQKLNGETIGFVPTMGALHKGHISLVERSVKENTYTIVSIFVNPKQFNDKSDFENYPITLENDLEMLEKAKCNLVFLPSNTDIYLNYDGFKMDFDGLDKIYEGEFRPGHFQGVVDIVYRLFSITEPHNSYFGAKDFQQMAVIKLMVKTAKLPITVIPCEIIREESGLAMSSRNERLSFEERKTASTIYKVLKSTLNHISINQNPSQLSAFIAAEIDKNDFLKAEYVVFCEPESLKTVYIFKPNTAVRLCVAVWCGKVRLIDNISLQF